MSEEDPQGSVQSHGAARLGGVTGKGFVPGGKTPNPGGMTKEHRALLDAFRDKARRFSDEAYRLLVDIAKGGVEDKDRLKALEMLLDRAWGKPAQPIVGDDEAPPVGGNLTSAAQREALAHLLAMLRPKAPAGDDKPNG